MRDFFVYLGYGCKPFFLISIIQFLFQIQYGIRAYDMNSNMVKTAMIGEHPVVSSDVIFDFYFVNFSGNDGSKNSAHHITVPKLNGKNYLQCS